MVLCDQKEEKKEIEIKKVRKKEGKKKRKEERKEGKKEEGKKRGLLPSSSNNFRTFCNKGMGEKSGMTIHILLCFCMEKVWM